MRWWYDPTYQLVYRSGPRRGALDFWYSAYYRLVDPVSELIPTGTNEEFVIIGQHMVNGDGVVLFVGKPIKVDMREVISTKGNSVTLTTSIETGYTKIRATSFAEAVRLWKNQT